MPEADRYANVVTGTAQLIHCIFAGVYGRANWELRLVVNTLKLGYNDENPFYEKIELNRHEATTLVLSVRVNRNWI